MFRQGRQGRARGARARLRRAGAFRRARVPAGWPPCWEEDRRKGRQKVRGGTPLQGGQAVQRDGVNTTRHARRGREMADGRAQGLEAPRPAAQAALSNAGPDSAGAIRGKPRRCVESGLGQALQLCGGARPPRIGPRRAASVKKGPSRAGTLRARKKGCRAGRQGCRPSASLGRKARKYSPPPPERRAMPPARWPTRAFRAGLLAGLPPMPFAEWRGGGREGGESGGGGGHLLPLPLHPPLRAAPHAARGSRRIVVHFGRIPARQESSARPNASMTRFAPAWCSRTSSKVTWTYRPCALLFLFSTMTL